MHGPWRGKEDLLCCAPPLPSLLRPVAPGRAPGRRLHSWERLASKAAQLGKQPREWGGPLPGSPWNGSKTRPQLLMSQARLQAAARGEWGPF